MTLRVFVVCDECGAEVEALPRARGVPVAYLVAGATKRQAAAPRVPLLAPLAWTATEHLHFCEHCNADDWTGPAEKILSLPDEPS